MYARAYHWLLLPDGTRQRQVVVCFDDEGRYLSHHALLGEEPFVEWVGGTFCLEKAPFEESKTAKKHFLSKKEVQKF